MGVRAIFLEADGGVLFGEGDTADRPAATGMGRLLGFFDVFFDPPTTIRSDFVRAILRLVRTQLQICSLTPTRVLSVTWYLTLGFSVPFDPK